MIMFMKHCMLTQIVRHIEPKSWFCLGPALPRDCCYRLIANQWLLFSGTMPHQQTRDVYQALAWCWPSVVDDGPTPSQHWIKCLNLYLESQSSRPDIAHLTCLMQRDSS